MKKNSILSLILAMLFLQIAAQDNFNTSRIGVWPYGWGNAVAHHENLIYLSYGRTVQVFDHINPEEPQLLGEVFIDDRLSVFAFDNGKAYAAGYNGFFILDITTAEQPEVISSLGIPVLASSICLYGNFAYLALENKSLYIIDINDANNPVIVAVHVMGYSLKQIVINDGLMVIAGTQGIRAYDLTDPHIPALVYHIPSSGQMRSLAFVDDLLVAFNSELGLMIYDITNLPDFNLLSTTYLYGYGTSICVEESIVAVTLSWIGFAIYDISNPSVPDSLGTFYEQKPNRNVILKDGYAFHCSGNTFNIIDLNNPYEITLLASIGLSGPSRDVYYWEDHLYINSAWGTVMAIDVADPQQPVKIWQIDGQDGPNTIHVKDDLLFFSYLSSLKVYDITVPSDPVYLNTLYATNSISNMLKHNDLLFVADYNNLNVFDISDISSANLLGVFPYQYIRDLTAKGNYLYCIRSTEFLILDISDPAGISQVSGTSTFFSKSLAVKDTLAYVVSGHDAILPQKSLKVFNVKEPATVFIEKSLEEGRYFEKVRIGGDYLYVYEKHIGLQIYDIHEITPVHCGFYRNWPYVIEMAIVNGIIYVPVSAGIDIVQNDLLTSAGGIFIERDERLKLFPNPAADMISFSLDDVKHKGMISYEIIQLNGSGIRSGKLQTGQQQISLHGLPAGVYVLHILQDGKKHKSGLFVKQ